MIFIFPLIFFLVSSPAALDARTIKVNNRCGHPIWIATLTNNNKAALPGGTPRLGQGQSHTFNIPNSGWAGRMWPKIGCNNQGQACEFGQSIPPCGAHGCQPPADTKIEFFIPSSNDHREIWYDISLVDGYSLPSEIIPSRLGGSCRRTNCYLSFDKCPRNEAKVGDLRVQIKGKTVACLSPCKKWNYPPPYGMGRNEQQGMGPAYCCPTPPVTPQKCRTGAVIQTEYVKTIHNDCKSAYSYAYDDAAGLHNCPNPTDFVVNFC